MPYKANFLKIENLALLHMKLRHPDVRPFSAVCHEALLYQFHLEAVGLLELLANSNWPEQENRDNSNKKNFKRNTFKILSDTMLLTKNYL